MLCIDKCIVFGDFGHKGTVPIFCLTCLIVFRNFITENR